jgi:CheY-like chemotaxis protein/CRP-like cAMP-binding protein
MPLTELNVQPAQRQSLRGLRILYVENQSPTRDLVTDALNQYGAAVTTATTVAEALDIIEREPPNLLLSNLNLAGRNGYDLIREVRRLPAYGGRVLPAVALSSSDESFEREHALAAGFTEHVTKPVHPERLVSLLARVKESGSFHSPPEPDATRQIRSRIYARLSDIDANRKRLDALVGRIVNRRAHKTTAPIHIRQPTGNRLLDALPPPEFDRVRGIIELVRFDQGETLCTAGDPCPYAYFPTSSVISLVWLLESGKSVEVLAVGRDGFAGVPFVFDARSSPHWWRVTVGGEAWRADPTDFAEALRSCPTLKRLLMGWAQFQFVEISQAVACRRIHTIEHQVARWLLAMKDRSGSADIRVTHDAIAELLGTRRAGVSVVMEGFRRDGLVASQRGNVRILDPRGLRAAACECYDALSREFDLLFHRDAGAA